MYPISLNASAADLWKLADDYPEEILAHPALPLLLLEDPGVAALIRRCRVKALDFAYAFEGYSMATTAHLMRGNDIDLQIDPLWQMGFYDNNVRKYAGIGYVVIFMVSRPFLGHRHEYFVHLHGQGYEAYVEEDDSGSGLGAGLGEDFDEEFGGSGIGLGRGRGLHEV